jgi:hypothetical protein
MGKIVISSCTSTMKCECVHSETLMGFSFYLLMNTKEYQNIVATRLARAILRIRSIFFNVKISKSC